MLPPRRACRASPPPAPSGGCGRSTGRRGNSAAAASARGRRQGRRLRRATRGRARAGAGRGAAVRGEGGRGVRVVVDHLALHEAAGDDVARALGGGWLVALSEDVSGHTSSTYSSSPNASPRLSGARGSVRDRASVLGEDPVCGLSVKVDRGMGLYWRS